MEAVHPLDQPGDEVEKTLVALVLGEVTRDMEKQSYANADLEPIESNSEKKATASLEDDQEPKNEVEWLWKHYYQKKLMVVLSVQ